MRTGILAALSNDNLKNAPRWHSVRYPRTNRIFRDGLRSQLVKLLGPWFEPLDFSPGECLVPHSFSFLLFSFPFGLFKCM